jgi:short-subunit dehydrogenase
MPEGSGRRALVTGASSGIGVAFARELAGRGYDLVLTARREDRLQALAGELLVRHGIGAVVQPADLTEPDAAERLMAALAARSLTVDVLINNAGYGVPGSYVQTTWAEQHRFLQLLVVAVAELAHRVMPGMVERGWGRIVNVASLAGLLPGVAGHTLYAASKAFVITFSESLALEGAPHGVHVTASCPGFTLTEFHDVTGTRDKMDRLPKFMMGDAGAVARGSYDAVMAGIPVFVPGRMNRSIATAARLLPKRLVMAAMRRTAGRYRKT